MIVYSVNSHQMTQKIKERKRLAKLVQKEKNDEK